MKDLYVFGQMLGCYFHQDFKLEYHGINEAINDLLQGIYLDNLIILYHQINNVLLITKNEKNLKIFLDEKFFIGVTPQSPGIEMNTYTEFLEYIRDKIKSHLELEGIKLTESKN